MILSALSADVAARGGTFAGNVKLDSLYIPSTQLKLSGGGIPCAHTIGRHEVYILYCCQGVRQVILRRKEPRACRY